MQYLIVLQEQLQAMARHAVAALPSIAIALLLLAATALVARFAARIASRLTGHTHLRSDLKELLQTLVKVAIWVVGFLLAATIAIPGFTFGGMIAGLGIGAVAIGFAFQDIFKNFLAGVLIMLREKMRLGDLIECDGIRGRVEHISLRETHVRQLTGELTVVPNSLLFEKPVQIVTDLPLRRDELVVAVDFDSDLQATQAAIEQALQSVRALDRSRPAEVYAQAIDSAAGAVSFLVRWWTDAEANNNNAVRSEIVQKIAGALREARIALPIATTELITHREDALEPA